MVQARISQLVHSSNRLASLTSLCLEIYQEFQCKHLRNTSLPQTSAQECFHLLHCRVFLFFGEAGLSCSSFFSVCSLFCVEMHKYWFFLSAAHRDVETQPRNVSDKRGKDAARLEENDNGCWRREGILLTILSKYVSYGSMQLGGKHKQLHIPINDRVLCCVRWKPSTPWVIKFLAIRNSR